MENREEIEQQLTEWAANNARRDSLVRAALVAGITPNRIHTLTGIARTTIYRIKETAMPARVYIRETDEGTETTKVFRAVNEIREVFEVDGEIVDDSLVYADSDPDEYLRRRDMELRGEGYRKS